MISKEYMKSGGVYKVQTFGTTHQYYCSINLICFKERSIDV
jgi:hypothetical protein